MTPAIDYLLIGHVAHDRTPEGPRLGGTVSYSAVAARALGLRVGILTSARPDDPVLAGLAGVPVHLIPADSSTIFVNTYDDRGHRRQVIEGQARMLTAGDIPPAWRDAPIVHLAPIARELDSTLHPGSFAGALVGLTPQGFLRAWDRDGHVYPVPWEGAEAALPHAIIILSDEDLGYSAAAEAQYAAPGHTLVVTRGYQGATLYHRGRRQDFPAARIEHLRHPTGAGDTFAAVFLAVLHRCPGDLARAMIVANAVTATYVESPLPEGVITLAEMESVLEHARVQESLQS